jgi:L-arabinokinase
VPALLARVREELAADFKPNLPIRVSRAPGRLDVMGGIADYTGSLVCEMPLDCAAAVALQARDDRQLQVFSFNLYDEHQPFTFRIPLDALTRHSADEFRREFNEPGRKWAAYLAGCLFVLHEQRLIDLSDASHKGLNLALHSTVPIGAGVSSSAAIEVATMMNLIDHFGIRDRIDPLALAVMCQRVENGIVDVPCGIMDQVTSCLGESGALLRMVCQPHELQPPLQMPPGVRVLGINSGVNHDVGGPAYARTRCAAFMGHRIILEKMGEMGAASKRELTSDPMRGYLANLDADDYKRFFRDAVPESLSGLAFLDRFGPTHDPVSSVERDFNYPIRHATDHHVLEARRVRRFAEFLEQAKARTSFDGKEPGRAGPDRLDTSRLQTSGTEVPRTKGSALDRAGHLMYASHQSYTMDAMLGAPECDLLVGLVRKHEAAGLYGARITGGGSGGTVAVLANTSDRAHGAIDEIILEYRNQTGLTPHALAGSSPGAWHIGTVIV